jgi:hypothetical protein
MNRELHRSSDRPGHQSSRRHHGNWRGRGRWLAGSQPGTPNQTRDSIEIELAEQALPEGSMAAPVSGYLYFPKNLLKKKKDAPLQLHYQLKDQTVILTLPEK